MTFTREKKAQNVSFIYFPGILAFAPCGSFYYRRNLAGTASCERKSIMIAPWPYKEEKWLDEEAEKTIYFLQDVIRGNPLFTGGTGYLPEECQVILNL